MMINFHKKLLYFIFIILGYFSCTPHQVFGEAKNMVLYNKSFKDTISANIYFESLFDKEYISSEIISEFYSRKMSLFEHEKLRFEIYVTDYNYIETPSLDTYTDENGNTTQIETTDYTVNLRGFIDDNEKCLRKHFYAGVVDGTRAGKSLLFGSPTEKGFVTFEGVNRRAVNRFVGKGINIILDLMNDKERGKFTPDECDSLQNLVIVEIPSILDKIEDPKNSLKSIIHQNYDQLKVNSSSESPELVHERFEKWIKNRLQKCETAQDFQILCMDSFVFIDESSHSILIDSANFDTYEQNLLIPFLNRFKNQKNRYSSKAWSSSLEGLSKEQGYFQQGDIVWLDNVENYPMKLIHSIEVFETNDGFKIYELSTTPINEASQ